MVKKPGNPKASSPDPEATPSAVDKWAEVLVCPRCKQENDAQERQCVRCSFSFQETRDSRGHETDPGPRGLGAGGEGRPESLVGTTVNGKYRVKSILGEGGFGVVYKVEHTLYGTGNVFALKVLNPALSDDQNFQARFVREINLARALIHENAIPIRDFGHTEDGHLFFTMDYCEGEPLKTTIAREVYLSVNRTLVICRQILAVMKLAHARGIVHRDLKPENIFIEKDRQGHDIVKVGDFGLAKSFVTAKNGAGRAGSQQGARGEKHSPEDITRGGIVGTPRYMSPEQAEGCEDLDARSDLYSIGVILYEMLYGHVPLERSSVEGKDGVLKTPPPHPAHPIPRPVWVVVQKALVVRREDRFQSAEEFLAAINSLPQYTPTYIEPLAARPRSFLRRGLLAASLLLLGGAAAVSLTLQEELRSLFGYHTAAPEERPPKPLKRRCLPATAGGAPVAPSGTQSVPLTVKQGSDSEPKEPAAGLSTSSAASVTGREQRPARALPPFPRESILNYLNFEKDQELVYWSYREDGEGLKESRQIVYRIESESDPKKSPRVFQVRVSPGDRQLTWIVDEKENEFRVKFSLPNPEAGNSTESDHYRTWLKLPSASALPGQDDSYYYKECECKVYSKPVDLNVPPQTDFSVFERCLRVDSREGNRIHQHFYQEGYGLVAVEVYEIRDVPAKDATPSSSGIASGLSESSPGLGSLAFTSSQEVDAPPPEGKAEKSQLVKIYGRYLIRHPEDAKTSEKPAAAVEKK